MPDPPILVPGRTPGQTPPAPGPSGGGGIAQFPTATTIFFIQATYFNPITGADALLPPHFWNLFEVDGPSSPPDRFSGNMTDTSGIATVVRDHKAPRPDARYRLVMSPLFPADVAAVRTGSSNQPNSAELSDVTARREVWIDARTNEWVAPTSIPRLEKRCLIRLPLWFSDVKARTGGFTEPPPWASTFARDGFIQGRETAQRHGSPARPWRLKIDQLWHRAHLQFRYFDFKDARERAVPPGLKVHAAHYTLDSSGKHEVVLGTGTTGDDNVIYVLAADTAANIKEFHYKFTTGSTTIVRRMPVAAADPELAVVTNVDPDPRARGLLPALWHSRSWEAWIGKNDPSADATTRRRVHFEDIAKSSSTSHVAPLCFHLEDAVLCNEDATAFISFGIEKVTVFDHLLRIRNPKPKRTYLTDYDMKRVILRGEEVVMPSAANPGLEGATRLVNFNERMFDLRWDDDLGTSLRVFGNTLTEGFIGARAAVARKAEADFKDGNSSLDGGGCYELHFVEAPFIRFQYVEGSTTVDAKLDHVLVYVGGELDDTKARFNAALVDTFHAQLSLASMIWDQRHPAEPPASLAFPRKNYVLVPDSGPRPPLRVLKLRHFFSTIVGRGQNGLQYVLQAGTAADRSNYDHPKRTLTIFGTDLNAASNIAGFDSDQVQASGHVMAHELGHVMGLPDEYYDSPTWARADRDPFMFMNPRPHTFEQPLNCQSQARPFFNDFSAMMTNGFLPRLRYDRHHLNAINEMASVADRPYALEYRNYTGNETLKYVLAPVPDAAIKLPSSPWHTVNILSPRLGTAPCDIFRLGPDEGSIEGIVTKDRVNPSAAPVADRVHAIMVVRPHFWFDFVGKFKTDADRVAVIRNFLLRIVTATFVQNISFLCKALDNPSFPVQRVLTVIHPMCEFGNRRTPAEKAALIATFSPVQIQIDFAPGKPNTVFDTPPPVPITMSKGDLDLAVLRLALGLPMRDGAGAPINTVDAPELQGPLTATLKELFKFRAGAPTRWAVSKLP